ncbi:hypothetical protein [Streptomyces sp. enrichment culture]|uniref:hypothetical protein n=1 Tax=Streptomyces sp. enrichment culture TaxID=1795815 RepID=UPI003F56EA13
MPNDIALVYDDIADCCSVLVAQTDIIIPEVYSLMQKVDTLLDHGLYLEQASPALKTAYEQFSRTLQSAGASLEMYAQMFSNIKTAFENNDNAAMAGALDGLDGDGGYAPEATENPMSEKDPREWAPTGGNIGANVNWNADHTQVTGVDK